jgi:hypothetical protein
MSRLQRADLPGPVGRYELLVGEIPARLTDASAIPFRMDASVGDFVTATPHDEGVFDKLIDFQLFGSAKFSSRAARCLATSACHP